MTRAELRSWPARDWEHDIDEVQLAEAEVMFHRALQYDPQNHTAHHRLGLVALRDYNFQHAIEHLEQSYQAVRDHRGIQKNLGYAYVWAGQIVKAKPLLSTIEEAREEMRIYGGWWRSQGRDDLSENAFLMESMLRNTTY
jgi:tetratricopeptide (TPR) repeat protein